MSGTLDTLGIVGPVLVWVAGLLLTAGAVTALVRIVRGPTLMDRVIASDVLLITVALALGADMIVRGHSETMIVMIVIAAVAGFSTVAVARTVAKHDRATDEAAVPATTATVPTSTTPLPTVPTHPESGQERA